MLPADVADAYAPSAAAPVPAAAGVGAERRAVVARGVCEHPCCDRMRAGCDGIVRAVGGAIGLEVVLRAALRKRADLAIDRTQLAQVDGVGRRRARCDVSQAALFAW